MIKISAIDRLMKSVRTINKAAVPLMSNQIQNVQQRLRTGVDTSGHSFAPYKDQERFRGRKPLSKAASLFDEARIDASTSSHGGVEFRATIDGEAAKIAHYQNVNRRFLGYSTEDREEAVAGLLKALKNGVKRGNR